MITPQILPTLISELPQDEINKAMDADHDFVLIELSIFNVGWFATVESMDYDDEVSENAYAEGNLFIDKDDFARLLDEHDRFYE